MLKAILETLYMVFTSMLIGLIIGGPLGIILYVTKEGGINENKLVNTVLDTLIINITRAIPFVILIVLLIPLSRIIVGKSYGTTAFIVPLAIGVAPFLAKVIYASLTEVDSGLIEAMQSMGANNFQIIFKAIIPEAIPSILNGLILTIISLIGYSAIAGVIGGGGLGNLAVIEGFERGNYKLMYSSTLVIIIIVEIIQYIGYKIVTKIEKRRGK